MSQPKLKLVSQWVIFCRRLWGCKHNIEQHRITGGLSVVNWELGLQRMWLKSNMKNWDLNSPEGVAQMTANEEAGMELDPSTLPLTFRQQS